MKGGGLSIGIENMHPGDEKPHPLIFPIGKVFAAFVVHVLLDNTLKTVSGIELYRPFCLMV